MEGRWKCRDLAGAVARCRKRNAGKIRCMLHPLSEYAAGPGQVDTAFEAYRGAMETIARNRIDASVAVKLSALGLSFDDRLCQRTFASLLRFSGEQGVLVEVDMEGKGSVAGTLSLAQACARKGHHLTLALQAYLDRTKGDIPAAIAGGITVRIVKGAYLGDTADFHELEERFRACAEIASSHGAGFQIGTHDPDLVSWAEGRFSPEEVEFGFLMGLADETKRRLSAGGWRVAEYVPYGEEADAYIHRRERYLEELSAEGRSPAP